MTDAPKQTEAEKKQRDRELNEALEESFPGSDPISATQPAPSKPDGDSKRKDKAKDKAKG
jgi:hypothetical protein